MEELDNDFTIYNNLHELQSSLFEFLCEFKLLCERLSIRFYLGYGTLLGAARHKGFIPWDDDIDLLMTREDYNSLITYFKNNDDNLFRLSCLELDTNHPLIFGKLIQKKANANLEKYFDGFGGLTIDIFPLDESRGKSLMQRIKILFIIYLKKIYSSKAKLSKKEMIFKKIARVLFVLPFLFVKNQSLLAFINKTIKKKKNNGGWFVCYGGLTVKECYINRINMWNNKTLLFNGSSFRVSDDFNQMLLSIYGSNWHKIPSLKQRTQHNHE